MRAALLSTLLLAGCPPAMTSGECTQDSECAPDLCTRDEQCTPANLVRSVKIVWTVNHVMPDPQTCANMPDLFVEVDGSTSVEKIAFAPVPCVAGIFNFDKLPKSYSTAAIGIDGSSSGMRTTIDASNTAQFDLFP